MPLLNTFMVITSQPHLLHRFTRIMIYWIQFLLAVILRECLFQVCHMKQAIISFYTKNDVQKGYFSETIGPLLLTSAFIIKQSEDNNRSSLLRQWCCFGDLAAEWKTNFLQAGAEVLEAVFTLQQKEDKIRLLDSHMIQIWYFLISANDKKLQEERYFIFIPIWTKWVCTKPDQEAIWTLTGSCQCSHDIVNVTPYHIHLKQMSFLCFSMEPGP